MLRMLRSGDQSTYGQPPSKLAGQGTVRCLAVPCGFGRATPGPRVAQASKDRAPTPRSTSPSSRSTCSCRVFAPPRRGRNRDGLDGPREPRSHMPRRPPADRKTAPGCPAAGARRQDQILGQVIAKVENPLPVAPSIPTDPRRHRQVAHRAQQARRKGDQIIRDVKTHRPVIPTGFVNGTSRGRPGEGSGLTEQVAIPLIVGQEIRRAGNIDGEHRLGSQSGGVGDPHHETVRPAVGSPGHPLEATITIHRQPTGTRHLGKSQRALRVGIGGEARDIGKGRMFPEPPLGFDAMQAGLAGAGREPVGPSIGAKAWR